jgi:hypothetical protein
MDIAGAQSVAGRAVMPTSEWAFRSSSIEYDWFCTRVSCQSMHVFPAISVKNAIPVSKTLPEAVFTAACNTNGFSFHNARLECRGKRPLADAREPYLGTV